MTTGVFSGGTAAVLWWQLVARSPSGMLTIALLVWGQSHLDSYALAGGIVAGYSVGFAIGAPLSARLLRAFGTTRVLLVTAAISGSALAGIAIVEPTLPAAVGLAALAGLSFPPVTPLARSIYSRIVPPAQIERVYALDAVAQEFIWVLGPLAATLVAGALGPPAAIAVCAGVLVLGASVFAFLRPARSFDPSPPPGRDSSKRMPRPALISLALLVTVGFFLVGGGAVVEVLIVSSFGYQHLATGLLLGVTAFGSLVGGLTIGRRRVGPRTLTLRLLIAAVGMAAAATVFDVPVWLAVPLFVSGLGVAPAFAAVHTIIARTIPPRQRTEAYAVSHSGQLVGMATGTAIAGVLVEQVAAPAVLLVAAGSVLAAAALALLPAVGRR
jgi:MFS family permease